MNTSQWARVAAEAKALTLESELYDARRGIEVMEEKVQGVMGRGDLLKIRAEVKGTRGGERVREKLGGLGVRAEAKLMT